MFNAFLVTPATCFLSPEQDIRAFTELVHSPDGGHVLFSKKHNQSFVYIPITHQVAWCDNATPAGPSCSTPNGPTMHSYMASEHQAGFVSGVGGFSVGKTMGQ
mmetsp:Transcript_4520/g.7366  ORF Transcript_4520/g.7366 Transcript_4520/m.7366 type:complete len:103 (-) Transcript_4520:138-446(-)